MIYGSVCSGIEAATAAWHGLGWEPAFFSEIEAFPKAVLAHHYPSVPDLGDFTTIGADHGPVDLLVGGTPCQSFSVAGLRGGMADARGNLALEFLRLAARLHARWILWENVPGVLSSNGGRDFGALLGGLAELGYGFAYRVLDAQFFGVAQRRRRVFVVGHAGGLWQRAAAVLFERASLRGDPPPRRAKGARSPRRAQERADGIFAPVEVASSFYSSLGTLGGGHLENGATPTLKRGQVNAIAFHVTQDPISSSGATPALGCGNALGCGTIGVAVDLQNMRLRPADASGTLQAAQDAGNRGEAVLSGTAVRRLTPRECERLQGFPDVRETVTITAWPCSASRLNDAPAATPSPRSPPSASRADGAEWTPSVRPAGESSSTSLPAPGSPVPLSVLIDCERQVVQLRSHGKLIWSANGAGESSASPLRMPVGDFVRLAALMTHSAVQATLAGRAGSPPSTSGSSPLLSGSASVSVSGADIAALADDAARFTDTASRCMKSITSGAGPSSPDFDSTLRTLCCCVAAAIGSFTRELTAPASSCALRVETLTPYTLIPGAKDGPRYRALGNSMAVPCMRWLGQRIQMVEDAVNVSEEAA